MKDNDTLDTTVDEWQAEMERLVPKNVPGETLLELCKKLKVRRTTMQNRLRTLIDNGRCIWREGIRIDKKGRSYTVVVYQLTPQKKASKK